MIFTGIDFSIKSAAMCTLSEGGLKFFSFIRNDCYHHDLAVALEQSEIYLPQVPPAAKEVKDISTLERTSMVDSEVLGKAVYSQWTQHHGNGPLALAIEGFSFGSKGNRLAQLSGYQYILRSKFYLSEILSPENFFVYSPMTVKATAGKGNFKKEQMIEAFINCDWKPLTQHKFHIAIRETPSLFQDKKGRWVKPIDDLVDSFWVLKTLVNRCIQ